MTDPDGLLFIGDPHLSSRRPGRRRDADFVATCIDRLAQGVALADAGNLVPVILGDLFDRPDEADHRLMALALRTLRAARHRPWCLVGNHDRRHAALTDDTALGVVRAAGAVATLEASGPAAVLRLDGVVVGLGATPHGQDIPRDVTGAFGTPVATVVWLTHHDLDFGRPYPGAAPTFPIAGCDVVVNGHMHGRERPRRHGRTRWFNPGNILRQTIDQIDHVPAVWSWRPRARHRLTPHPLRHERDVFDRCGHLAPTLPPGTGPDDPESVFAALLRAETAHEMTRSADGTLLWEEIARLLDAEQAPDELRVLMRELHRQAVADGA